MGGYDSVWEEWAAKARLDVKFNESFSAFVMAGLKDDDDGEPNFYGRGMATGRSGQAAPRKCRRKP
jgi:hypothetical protein